jgi:hypothetical protein
MQIIPFVIITTLPFPILLVQCIHCLIQYIVHKTRASSLSRSAKCVFSAYAICISLTLVALPVPIGFILHKAIEGLLSSEEERADTVWIPKLMPMYCLSSFCGLCTHVSSSLVPGVLTHAETEQIGLPAAVTKRHPLQKIVWPIAGLTAIATVVLSVLGSVLAVRTTTGDAGYILLSCGNSLPYFHSCGMMWFFIPKDSQH